MSINPVSTYRIQFNKDFTFSDFEKIIPYMVKLGVRTIYASPIFESAPGSTHGYDGTDPNRINPEIGTEEQLLRISHELKKNNILWLQDIVPNHLAFHENNKWLMDILEKGRSSAYAPFFDIIWDHPDFNGKVMVPFPGSSLEHELKNKFPDAINYVITPWQDTDRKINYRRFFLVNGLICTNIQDDKVFHAYHSLIKKLSDDKIFDGLRVDHIDGIYDPVKYLHDLRKLAGGNTYIVVEKILEPGENMPEHWPVQGNSGYDFLSVVNNVLTNRQAEYELTTLYFDITRNHKSVEEQVKEKKEYILHHHMYGELDNLTRLYRESGLAGDDVNDEDIRKWIADYLVSCPVYRYYGEDVPVMKRDKGKTGEGVRTFYNRCMQFTGPLMAKGVEDTLMYTYNRFIGHNEVGDSPDFFGYTTDQFHDLMLYRQQHWPYSLNGTSTHDTKRGEDARARLNALTFFYNEWSSLVIQWMEQNEKLKTNGSPDKNDEYMLYQALAGSYPVNDSKALNSYPSRLEEYIRKALREAKVHSNWADPNTGYEQECIDFVFRLLEKNSPFQHSFLPFVEKIAGYGMFISFSQLILKFMCPGIPDTYQGTELWDLSLVDPDNRRPVDFQAREEMLGSKKSFDELWDTRWTGEIKLSLLHTLFQIRNEYSGILTNGEYVPVKIEDRHKDHALAFLRKHDRSALLIVVPVIFPMPEIETEDFITGLVPENLFQRKLLHFSDFFQIIYLDLVL